MMPFTGELVILSIQEILNDSNHSLKYLSNSSIPVGDGPEDSTCATCQRIRDFFVGFIFL